MIKKKKKTPNTLGIEITNLNVIKTIDEKSKGTIILNGEK